MELSLSTEVSEAIRDDRPIVALESTVIAHGLPYPRNLETALNVERAVRESGAVPATIAIIDGVPTVGLSDEQLESLASSEAKKVSMRDLPVVVASRKDGATTVASTLFIADRAGIAVFATGGIGGVHRGAAADVSADLPMLASTPMLVVCAGAKIVLDLFATREWLETHGVAVLGWKTAEFPAFYDSSSGLPVDQSVQSVEEIAAIVRARNELGLSSAILVAAPVPDEHAIGTNELTRILEEAIEESKARAISGKELTPFLLRKMADASDGRTVDTNIALLLNNARIAAEIAVSLI